MLQATRGIVFKYLNYSESSIIVKIFTEELGLQSYIVKGARSKRAKMGLALFQPLTLLDLVAYHKENKSLHHLREVKVAFAYHSIPTNITKRSLLFFLDELLYKSIREESSNKPLFEWLFNALTWLDLSDNSIMNYHLVFMVQFSRFLGFYPKKPTIQNSLHFDLQEGLFTASEPEHPNYVSGELALKLNTIFECTFEDSSQLGLNNEIRRKLLDVLVTFYRLHVPGFGEMKSVEVLKIIS